MDIYSDVSIIKGVGEKSRELLRKCGIFSVIDLLLYFPRDYETVRLSKNINEFNKGEKLIIQCRFIKNEGSFRTKTGKTITKLLFTDGNNVFRGTWFNMPYIFKNFKLDNEYVIMGKVNIINGEIIIESPMLINDKNIVGDKLIPLYNLKETLRNNYLIKLIGNVLSQIDIEENLPQWVIDKNKFYSLDKAIRFIHSPSNMDELNEARRRLKFQELFTYSLKVLMLRDYINKGKIGITYKIAPELTTLKEKIPYKLTDAQNRSIREILLDEKKPFAMNRLLQGDVGCGKTIVAFIAMFNVVKNGYQSVLLAPTEILANQHFQEAKKLLGEFNINIGLLTGSISPKKKEKIKADLKDGYIDIIIGTHALIQDDVEFKNLGMVITDEQHRFGVMQRSKIFNKGNNVDILVMTATPIPRTLGLYLYGDLDISVIDELPPTRKKVDTRFVAAKSSKEVFNFTLNEIKNGRQAYVVCPLVEENEKLLLNSVSKLVQELSLDYFSDFKVEMIYGKMKGKEKDSIMTRFKKGEIDVLVSTTVVEVGVNVPNATVMIIENAERFGLSQLHQLRGRVGRGEHKSYCFLIADAKSKNVKHRLEVMVKSNDGFYIAEEDLKIRGSGEIFGFRQHGDNGLILSDVLEDSNILKEANREARLLIESTANKDINIKNHILNKIEVSSKYICFN